MNYKKALILVIVFLCILSSLGYVYSQSKNSYATSTVIVPLSQKECSKLFSKIKVLRAIQIKTQLMSGEEFKCTQSCYYYEDGVVNTKLVGSMQKGYVQDLKKDERKPLKSACGIGEDKFYVEIGPVENQQQILKQFSDKGFDLASISENQIPVGGIRFTRTAECKNIFPPVQDIVFVCPRVTTYPSPIEEEKPGCCVCSAPHTLPMGYGPTDKLPIKYRYIDNVPSEDACIRECANLNLIFHEFWPGKKCPLFPTEQPQPPLAEGEFVKFPGGYQIFCRCEPNEPDTNLIVAAPPEIDIMKPFVKKCEHLLINGFDLMGDAPGKTHVKIINPSKEKVHLHLPAAKYCVYAKVKTEDLSIEEVYKPELEPPNLIIMIFDALLRAIYPLKRYVIIYPKIGLYEQNLYLLKRYIGLYECSDSIDNDGDGFIDYPNDPGCSSPFDDSEYNSVNKEVALTPWNYKNICVLPKGKFLLIILLFSLAGLLFYLGKKRKKKIYYVGGGVSFTCGLWLSLTNYQFPYHYILNSLLSALVVLTFIYGKKSKKPLYELSSYVLGDLATLSWYYFLTICTLLKLPWFIAISGVFTWLSLQKTFELRKAVLKVPGAYYAYKSLRIYSRARVIGMMLRKGWSKRTIDKAFKAAKLIPKYVYLSSVLAGIAVGLFLGTNYYAIIFVGVPLKIACLFSLFGLLVALCLKVLKRSPKHTKIISILLIGLVVSLSPVQAITIEVPGLEEAYTVEEENLLYKIIDAIKKRVTSIAKELRPIKDPYKRIALCFNSYKELEHNEALTIDLLEKKVVEDPSIELVEDDEVPSFGDEVAVAIYHKLRDKRKLTDVVLIKTQDEYYSVYGEFKINLNDLFDFGFFVYPEPILDVAKQLFGNVDERVFASLEKVDHLDVILDRDGKLLAWLDPYGRGEFYFYEKEGNGILIIDWKGNAVYTSPDIKRYYTRREDGSFEIIEFDRKEEKFRIVVDGVVVNEGSYEVTDEYTILKFSDGSESVIGEDQGYTQFDNRVKFSFDGDKSEGEVQDIYNGDSWIEKDKLGESSLEADLKSEDKQVYASAQEVFVRLDEKEHQEPERGCELECYPCPHDEMKEPFELNFRKTISSTVRSESIESSDSTITGHAGIPIWAGPQVPGQMQQRLLQLAIWNARAKKIKKFEAENLPPGPERKEKKRLFGDLLQLYEKKAAANKEILDWNGFECDKFLAILMKEYDEAAEKICAWEEEFNKKFFGSLNFFEEWKKSAEKILTKAKSKFLNLKLGHTGLDPEYLLTEMKNAQEDIKKLEPEINKLSKWIDELESEFNSKRIICEKDKAKAQLAQLKERFLAIKEFIKRSEDILADLINSYENKKKIIDPQLESEPELILVLLDIHDVYAIWQRLYYAAVMRLYYYSIKIATIVACCELHIDCKCGKQVPPLKLRPWNPRCNSYYDCSISYGNFHYIDFRRDYSPPSNQQIVYSIMEITNAEKRPISISEKINAKKPCCKDLNNCWSKFNDGIKKISKNLEKEKKRLEKELSLDILSEKLNKLNEKIKLIDSKLSFLIDESLNQFKVKDMGDGRVLIFYNGEFLIYDRNTRKLYGADIGPKKPSGNYKATGTLFGNAPVWQHTERTLLPEMIDPVTRKECIKLAEELKKLIKQYNELVGQYNKKIQQLNKLLTERLREMLKKVFEEFYKCIRSFIMKRCHGLWTKLQDAFKENINERRKTLNSEIGSKLQSNPELKDKYAPILEQLKKFKYKNPIDSAIDLALIEFDAFGKFGNLLDYWGVKGIGCRGNIVVVVWIDGSKEMVAYCDCKDPHNVKTYDVGKYEREMDSAEKMLDKVVAEISKVIKEAKTSKELEEGFSKLISYLENEMNDLTYEEPRKIIQRVTDSVKNQKNQAIIDFYKQKVLELIRKCDDLLNQVKSSKDAIEKIDLLTQFSEPFYRLLDLIDELEWVIRKYEKEIDYESVVKALESLKEGIISKITEYKLIVFQEEYKIDEEYPEWPGKAEKDYINKLEKFKETLDPKTYSALIQEIEATIKTLREIHDKKRFKSAFAFEKTREEFNKYIKALRAHNVTRYLESDEFTNFAKNGKFIEDLESAVNKISTWIREGRFYDARFAEQILKVLDTFHRLAKSTYLTNELLKALPKKFEEFQEAIREQDMTKIKESHESLLKSLEKFAEDLRKLYGIDETVTIEKILDESGLHFSSIKEYGKEVSLGTFYKELKEYDLKKLEVSINLAQKAKELINEYGPLSGEVLVQLETYIEKTVPDKYKDMAQTYLENIRRYQEEMKKKILQEKQKLEEEFKNLERYVKEKNFEKISELKEKIGHIFALQLQAALAGKSLEEQIDLLEDLLHSFMVDLWLEHVYKLEETNGPVTTIWRSPIGDVEIYSNRNFGEKFGESNLDEIFRIIIMTLAKLDPERIPKLTAELNNFIYGVEECKPDVAILTKIAEERDSILGKLSLKINEVWDDKNTIHTLREWLNSFFALKIQLKSLDKEYYEGLTHREALIESIKEEYNLLSRLNEYISHKRDAERRQESMWTTINRISDPYDWVSMSEKLESEKIWNLMRSQFEILNKELENGISLADLPPDEKRRIMEATIDGLILLRWLKLEIWTYQEKTYFDIYTRGTYNIAQFFGMIIEGLFTGPFKLRDAFEWGFGQLEIEKEYENLIKESSALEHYNNSGFDFSKLSKEDQAIIEKLGLKDIEKNEFIPGKTLPFKFENIDEISYMGKHGRLEAFIDGVVNPGSLTLMHFFSLGLNALINAIKSGLIGLTNLLLASERVILRGLGKFLLFSGRVLRPVLKIATTPYEISQNFETWLRNSLARFIGKRAAEVVAYLKSEIGLEELIYNNPIITALTGDLPDILECLYGVLVAKPKSLILSQIKLLNEVNLHTELEEYIKLQHGLETALTSEEATKLEKEAEAILQQMKAKLKERLSEDFKEGLSEQDIDNFITEYLDNKIKAFQNVAFLQEQLEKWLSIPESLQISEGMVVGVGKGGERGDFIKTIYLPQGELIIKGDVMGHGEEANPGRLAVEEFIRANEEKLKEIFEYEGLDGVVKFLRSPESIKQLKALFERYGKEFRLLTMTIVFKDTAGKIHIRSLGEGGIFICDNEGNIKESMARGRKEIGAALMPIPLKIEGETVVASSPVALVSDGVLEAIHKETNTQLQDNPAHLQAIIKELILNGPSSAYEKLKSLGYVLEDDVTLLRVIPSAKTIDQELFARYNDWMRLESELEKIEEERALKYEILSVMNDFNRILAKNNGDLIKTREKILNIIEARSRVWKLAYPKYWKLLKAGLENWVEWTVRDRAHEMVNNAIKSGNYEEALEIGKRFKEELGFDLESYVRSKILLEPLVFSALQVPPRLLEKWLEGRSIKAALEDASFREKLLAAGGIPYSMLSLQQLIDVYKNILAELNRGTEPSFILESIKGLNEELINRLAKIEEDIKNIEEWIYSFSRNKEHNTLVTLVHVINPLLEKYRMTKNEEYLRFAEWFLNQLVDGKVVDLPIFYHATNLDAFRSIIKKGIMSSRAYAGTGIFVSVKEILWEYGKYAFPFGLRILSLLEKVVDWAYLKLEEGEFMRPLSLVAVAEALSEEDIKMATEEGYTVISKEAADFLVNHLNRILSSKYGSLLEAIERDFFVPKKLEALLDLFVVSEYSKHTREVLDTIQKFPFVSEINKVTLYLAALFHDFGKLFWTEKDVNPRINFNERWIEYIRKYFPDLESKIREIYEKKEFLDLHPLVGAEIAKYYLSNYLPEEVVSAVAFIVKYSHLTYERQFNKNFESIKKKFEEELSKFGAGRNRIFLLLAKLIIADVYDRPGIKENVKKILTELGNEILGEDTIRREFGTSDLGEALDRMISGRFTMPLVKKDFVKLIGEIKKVILEYPDPSGGVYIYTLWDEYLNTFRKTPRIRNREDIALRVEELLTKKFVEAEEGFTWRNFLDFITRLFGVMRTEHLSENLKKALDEFAKKHKISKDLRLRIVLVEETPQSIKQLIERGEDYIEDYFKNRPTATIIFETEEGLKVPVTVNEKIVKAFLLARKYGFELRFLGGTARRMLFGKDPVVITSDVDLGIFPKIDDILDPRYEAYEELREKLKELFKDVALGIDDLNARGIIDNIRGMRGFAPFAGFTINRIAICSDGKLKPLIEGENIKELLNDVMEKKLRLSEGAVEIDQILRFVRFLIAFDCKYAIETLRKLQEVAKEISEKLNADSEGMYNAQFNLEKHLLKLFKVLSPNERIRALKFLKEYFPEFSNALENAGYDLDALARGDWNNGLKNLKRYKNDFLAIEQIPVILSGKDLKDLLSRRTMKLRLTEQECEVLLKLFRQQIESYNNPSLDLRGKNELISQIEIEIDSYKKLYRENWLEMLKQDYEQTQTTGLAVQSHIIRENTEISLLRLLELRRKFVGEHIKSILRGDMEFAEFYSSLILECDLMLFELRTLLDLLESESASTTIIGEFIIGYASSEV